MADLPSVNTHQALLSAGLDPTTASFAASQIDNAKRARSGVAMNEIEIADFNAKVEQKWRDDFATNKALVQRAFNRAGAHGQVLQEAVLASGRDVALFVYETLKNSERHK